MQRALLTSTLSLLALGLCLSASGQEASIEPETDWASKEKATRDLRNRLFKGETKFDSSDNNHKEAVEWVAKEATYRLYWYRSAALIRGPEAEKGTDDKKLRPPAILAELESRLSQLHRTKDRGGVAAPFCRALGNRARDVILSDSPIASVNAARVLFMISARSSFRGALASPKEWAEEVLPRLGGDTGDHLLGILAELAASPKVNQGAKYYVFRAMGDLLSLPRQSTPLVKKETEEKAHQAVMTFLGNPPSFTLATGRDELEGYKMLRAQAVRALAAPGHWDLPSDKASLWLARIAGADGLVTPYPRLEERIEAAVGLARMINEGEKRHPDLAMDLAAHQVGATVASLASEAQPPDTKAVARLRPWKVDASRLLEAVEAMRVSKDAHVTQVIEKCRPVLSDIEEGKEIGAAGTALRDWLINNPAPSKALLRSDKASTIQPDRQPVARDDKGKDDKGKGGKEK
jgi:hypothetical protein